MMTLGSENNTFYPTPKALVERMIKKIQGNPGKILEPSAGKGDIIEGLRNGFYLEEDDSEYGKTTRYGYRKSFDHADINAIEKDPDLQATLRGKGIKILDTDFLGFCGPDKFDLIIANPPFDHGEKHLLKAIDILYRGQIIFLLNAETIRNPHTRSRQELVKKLTELNAEVEFIEGGFKNAERKTSVDVALVNIIIDRHVESDLFAGVDDMAEKVKPELEQNYEVTTGKHIEETVAEYNQMIQLAANTIVDYYKRYPKIGKYIGLNKEPKVYHGDHDTLTSLMQGTLNETVRCIRKDFWNRTLEFPDVRKRMTSDKRDEFHHQVEHQSTMDFTEHNIRQFVLNLINSFPDSLRTAIVKMFDKFTIKHCYNGGPNEKNIHYFNGWKTNKAFKVNRRIVLPFYGGYGDGPFMSYGEWKVHWDVQKELHDIDIVMNYFDGMDGAYSGISDKLSEAFARKSNTASSTYFSNLIAHKKGTLHLTFRDEDILRRFNIEACKGKEWLPEDYGTQPYKELDMAHKAIADSFEGKDEYVANYGRIGIECPERDALPEPGDGQISIFGGTICENEG